MKVLGEKNKTVRILLRVSSNQQLEADGDLGVQREIIQDYISKQDKWILDEKEYFEGSNSGYKNAVMDRDVLQQALQDAMNHEYDILVVYKDDRIGRRMWEIGAYVMQLKNYGVDIYTVKDGCISPEKDDIMGQMMLALRYGNAQKSSADTGMRVKDTAQKLVQKGKFMGGKAPYGYELVFSGEISKHGRALKKLQLVEEQAEIVRYIYELSVNKEYGSSKIAKKLNEDVYCSRHAPNDYWKSGTITSILTNPVYAGYVAYKRREHRNGRYLKLKDCEWVKSSHRNEEIAIVEEAVWDEVQRKRKLRSKKYQKSFSENEYKLMKRNDGILTLIDVAYCGYCGAKLTNGTKYNYWTIKDTGEKRSSKKGYYKCQGSWQGIPHDKLYGFAANKVETVVFHDLCKYLDRFMESVELSTYLKQSRHRESDQLKKISAQYQREWDKVKKGIDVMEEHMPEAILGDYVLSVDELAHTIKKHKSKQQELEEKLKSIEKMQSGLHERGSDLLKWKELFMKGDRETKRVLVNKLIDRIEIQKEEIHILYKLRV